MTPPVPTPSQSPTTPDHCAGQVARPGGHAPSCRPGATGTALGAAGQRRTTDQDVSLSGDTDRAPDQVDQSIARIFCRCSRTRVAQPASAVHLARCDPRQANTRSFGAPDRPIAVPHAGRRACESRARGRGSGGSSKEQNSKNRRGPWCRRWE